MKDITVLYSFPLRLGRVGIGMTAWHQVSGLLKKGVNVYLCCGSCEKPVKGLDFMHETLTFGGVKLPMRLLFGKTKSIHDKLVARQLKKIGRTIDIVHAWPSGAKETLETAKSLGIKTILERPNTHTRYAFNVVQAECQKLGVKLPKSHSHSLYFPYIPPD